MPRYEFSEGTSSKFWEIKLSGTSFTTTYGKIGTTGQTTLKQFTSDAEAKKEYDKLIAEKTRKGYKPAGANGEAGAADVRDGGDQPAPKAAKAKPSSTQATGTASVSSASVTPGARYFEFVEGTSSKFWEIVLDGTSVNTRYGKIGTAGQQTTKDFDSTSEAFKEYDKLVTEKTKKGYEEKGGGGGAGGGGGDARNPDLETAIIDDPEDGDAYLVLADWLQGQGDPRGELIALQAAGKTAPAKKLLAQQVDYFLGPLADHVKCWDGSDKDAFTWKHGFIHAVRLSHDHYANEDFEGSLAEILDLLLRHPSGRFLAALTLNYNNDPNEDTLDDLIAILAKKAPATLRKIKIGDEVDQISWYHVGNLGKLWKAVPNLRTFEIEAGSFTLGAIDLPNLTRAEVHTGGLAKADAKSIANAKWPCIEHLDVWFGQEDYGGDATVKDILPLLARTDLPKLRHLGLRNAAFTDELVDVLPGAKLLRQLKVLDLGMGILTDEGAEKLAAHEDAFGHLEVLDISDTYVSGAGLAALKGIARSLVAKDLREDDDPEYRYPSVGE